jgi:CBS domain-containing protein
MKCPSCGYDNLPGADACEACQTSLTREDVPQADTDHERSLMEDPIACLQPIRPLTADPDTPLDVAIRRMRDHGIGCLLVVTGEGRLTGILTERDLLQKVAGLGLDLGRCPVKDIMSGAPESGRAEHPLGYALQRMIVSDIRYLPLVDEHGRPIGIVSSRDVIGYMAARFNDSGGPLS